MGAKLEEMIFEIIVRYYSYLKLSVLKSVYESLGLRTEWRLTRHNIEGFVLTFHQEFGNIPVKNMYNNCLFLFSERLVFDNFVITDFVMGRL